MLYALLILPNILQQLRDGYVFVCRQKGREFFAPLRKLACSSFQIVRLQMIEGCSDLNDSLDKDPVYIPVFMPQIFEDFVRLKKSLIVEFFQPTVKSLIHHILIIANRPSKFKAKSLPILGIQSTFWTCSVFRHVTDNDVP
jgi:hypothetical protein